MASETVDLLVCTTCRSALPANPLATQETDQRPGSLLARALLDSAPDGLRVLEVECLSNCSRGCTIALRKQGAWTYVYGNLDPESHLATVIEGACKYRDADRGVVPWRERPEHFRKNCIARIPPLELPNV